MPLARFLLILPAFFSVACHMVELAPADPLRLRSDTLFTDTELKFSIALPAGWWEYGRSDENAHLDFFAGKYGPEPGRSQEVRVDHWTLTNDTGSLADYMATRYNPARFDSMSITVETRTGVEVGRVDLKQHYSFVGSSYVHRENWRDLYFRRFGRIAWIRIVDLLNDSDPSPDVDFIDSSLTFF